MNQMIENNIQEYPGDNATLAEYFHSVRCMIEKKRNFRKIFLFYFIVCCEIYTPATVVYIQEVI